MRADALYASQFYSTAAPCQPRCRNGGLFIASTVSQWLYESLLRVLLTSIAKLTIEPSYLCARLVGVRDGFAYRSYSLTPVT
jgi:hypothetical protein